MIRLSETEDARLDFTGTYGVNVKHIVADDIDDAKKYEL